MKKFHYENMKHDILSHVGKVMTRFTFFDLKFLWELDEANSKTYDFEEINFTYNLIYDIVKIVGERVRYFKQIENP